ncbi:MAG: tRNA lysidine(34) synthetase TilS [Candidatus Eisenbacteria bacterium]
MLVALSGGADSTALLLALHNLRHEFGYELAAAHLDHRLRGAASSADRVFARGLCARLLVPLADAAWDTRARMKRRGLSGQDGLRTLRREFLLGAARRLDARSIATAHTADDQLETVLLRLARGAGLRGLGAMSARRGRWIRPLLEAPRADIEADLTRIGQHWREDASNASLDYARNRVRHLVVPALLEALVPGSGEKPVARAALARRVMTGLGELRAAHRLLERRARRLLENGTTRASLGRAGRALESGVRRPPGGRWLVKPVRRTDRRPGRIQVGEIRLDSGEWRSYPAVIQRLALREAWARLTGGRVGLTARHVAAIADLMRSARAGARAELPLGVKAVREGRTLTLKLAPNTGGTSTSATRENTR